MMAERTLNVWVVDDDQSVRWVLEKALRQADMEARSFERAEHLLDAIDHGEPDVLITDVRMPGMSGLDLQEHFLRENIRIPIIIITGHGDVPMAVRAMKSGAVDFIEKPFNDEMLLDSIRNALTLDQELRNEQAQRAEIAARLAHLTPRELEVMGMVTSGQSNKEIASRLGVSAKTVEAHRARVMDKMQADSLADLVKMAMLANFSEQQA